MVDALVSGASAERRVGSSPILGTRSSTELLFLCPNRARSACGASADSSVVGCCRRSSPGGGKGRWFLVFRTPKVVKAQDLNGMRSFHSLNDKE